MPSSSVSQNMPLTLAYDRQRLISSSCVHQELSMNTSWDYRKSFHNVMVPLAHTSLIKTLGVLKFSNELFKFHFLHSAHIKHMFMNLYSGFYIYGLMNYYSCLLLKSHRLELRDIIFFPEGVNYLVIHCHSQCQSWVCVVNNHLGAPSPHHHPHHPGIGSSNTLSAPLSDVHLLPNLYPEDLGFPTDASYSLSSLTLDSFLQQSLIPVCHLCLCLSTRSDDNVWMHHLAHDLKSTAIATVK